MLPQNPPQPSCSYFPLKLSSVGIQTSKLIIESLVGVAVPATRQNAGSPVSVVQPGLPVVQPGGVLNVPPVTDWAAVTCASTGRGVVRVWQGQAYQALAAARRRDWRGAKQDGEEENGR